ncbi:MAG: hypothetical protein ACW987_19985 [Candidatus Thorarchaeota archaeon]|jgi:hypothetical protein
MPKIKKKSKKKGSAPENKSPWTRKELEVAAMYFAVENSGQQPRRMTPASIEQEFWSIQGDIDFESCGDDPDYDTSSCMQEEKAVWMKRLLEGSKMEIDDWTKLRKEVYKL